MGDLPFSGEKGGRVDGERGERRLREVLGGEVVLNLEKVSN